MSIQDNALKGILKSLKAINALLGASAGVDLAADLNALITAEAATNVIFDTAVTVELATNVIVDSMAAFVGVPAGADSIAEQIVALYSAESL